MYREENKQRTGVKSMKQAQDTQENGGHKHNKRYYVHSAVTLFLMFAFGYVIPPFGGISSLGMRVLGVFLGLLYGWTFVEMLWPSLISFIALGISGAMSVTEAFASGFGSNLTLILIFVFIFAAYMEASGLNSFVAHWFISRKIAIGRPWIFTGLIIFCSFFLGAMTNLFASMVICWSVFYRLAELLGYKPYDKYVLTVLFGILLGATLGSMAVPFQAVPVIALGLYESIMGTQVNFLQYTFFCAVMSSLLIICYLLLCKLIYRPDVSRLKSKEDRFADYRSEKLNKEERNALAILGIFLLFVFLPGILPAQWLITTLLRNWGIVGSVSVCLTILMIIRRKDGQGLIDFTKLAQSGVNWEIVILIAATAPVCNALESPEAGVLDVVLNVLIPVMDRLNPFLLVAFVMICLLIMTQFAHNAVLCIVFVPMLVPLATQYQVNPMIMVVAILFATHVAFSTPAASSQAAMLFGNSAWVTKKEVFKLAVLFILWVMIFYVVILIPCLFQFFA